MLQMPLPRWNPIFIGYLDQFSNTGFSWISTRILSIKTVVIGAFHFHTYSRSSMIVAIYHVSSRLTGHELIDVTECDIYIYIFHTLKYAWCAVESWRRKKQMGEKEKKICHEVHHTSMFFHSSFHVIRSSSGSVISMDLVPPCWSPSRWLTKGTLPWIFDETI